MAKAKPVEKVDENGNKDYKVLYIAKDANTGEDIVVYRGNYGNCPVFVRPLRNFNDFVDRNGYRGPRFQEIKY